MSISATMKIFKFCDWLFLTTLNVKIFNSVKYKFKVCMYNYKKNCLLHSCKHCNTLAVLRIWISICCSAHKQQKSVDGHQMSLLLEQTPIPHKKNIIAVLVSTCLLIQKKIVVLSNDFPVQPTKMF